MKSTKGGPKAGKYPKAKSMPGINPRAPTKGGKAKKFGGKG